MSQSSEPDFNDALPVGGRPGQDRNKGGPDTLEDPRGGGNLRWQTRPAPPTDYENRLADALQALFERGTYELGPIVEGLNEAGVEPPDGGRWTEDSFKAAMSELGADPFARFGR